MLQVIAADLDGDGDCDLVTSNINNARVVWYENLLVEATPAPLQVTTPSPDPTATDTLTPAPSSMISPTKPTQTPASSIDRTARKVNQDCSKRDGDKCRCNQAASIEGSARDRAFTRRIRAWLMHEVVDYPVGSVLSPDLTASKECEGAQSYCRPSLGVNNHLSRARSPLHHPVSFVSLFPLNTPRSIDRHLLYLACSHFFTHCCAHWSRANGR